MATRKRKNSNPGNSNAQKMKLHASSHRDWDVDDVCEYLAVNQFKNVTQVFQREQIVGSVLSDLTEERLEKIGVEKMGTRLQLLQLFRNLSQDNLNLKVHVFNDPIHGHIEVHPLCVKIIDTPQFQRLRYIKQLGACYFVFPGAAHNRFEHSIGVCYLAGQLAKTLQTRQPDLPISDVDVLCVQIAGLCHDLGHGPYSHMFDNWFIPYVRPKKNWKHEQASVDMFDYLIEDNNLMGVIKDYGLNEKDITFIKEQIAGPLQRQNNKTACPYRGREKEKSFLYEIVANKRNGIDVDKWDYFARDCHNLGIPNNFDYRRFQQFARVINVDGSPQICCREKEVSNLYDMFHTRNTLHRRAYQHKVNKIIESMIVEALVKADDHIKIPGTNGTMVKISETIDDMVAFCKLTDNIIHQILQTTEPEIEESRTILRKIFTRKLYKCIGQTRPPDGVTINQDEIPQIQEGISAILSTAGHQVPADNIVVHIIDLDYGMGDQNPIDHVRFYSKANPNEAMMVRKNQVSQMLPERFAEQHIRVYCKDIDPVKIQQATLCFNKWCKEKGFTPPKGGDVNDTELTPLKASAMGQNSYPTEHGSKSRLSF